MRARQALRGVCPQTKAVPSLRTQLALQYSFISFSLPVRLLIAVNFASVYVADFAFLLCFSFLTENSDDASLSRSASVATGLNIMKRQKVKTIFPHTAGSNKTLLSFAQGDIITLLVAEEKDGWLYGEHDSTKLKGWFPSSYTRPLQEPAGEKAFVPVPSPAPVRSVSSVNLVEKGDVVLPPPDYLGSSQTDKGVESAKGTTVKTPTDRPENAGPKPDLNGFIKPPFLSGENPFATVKLRPTVTNDRSAPIIR